ncbi:hypothetical protein ACFXN2_06310 [Streptomyces kronopolitis]
MGAAPGGVVYVVSQSGITVSAIDSTSSTVIATAARREPERGGGRV